ncbi:ATP-binding protein involved in chromosome partitioning [Syntrophus gentianae]|uniref:Iron-sulfur cluster carrier protein n=1 Tax=Syntrophus gentianae TaxID=43775 RepID=A0A1H7V5C0_9BACT|nr:Mrp/NBP35 family ATP-binding protein [Syntrophus gentianae]SEM04290.1 ATP-binding protein involved in chromosome partitioning [Syntrophus gentianae]
MECGTGSWEIQRNDMAVNERGIREALKVVLDPELKKSLLDLGMIRDISVEEGQVSLSLALTTAKCPRKDDIVDEIKRVLGRLPGVSGVNIKLSTLNREELTQLFPKHPLVGLEKVRHVLAVASGKGGVGKTTIAINVALALAGKGLRIGLLDADVYGPSVPVMLAIEGSPEEENKTIIPIEKFGLRVMSLGMITEKGQPIVWRGPLVSKAIKQLLGEVMWGELDYLVVDLPPGTGDPSITIAQSIPNASILMVTTPQEVALADVRRAIDLFKKFEMGIVGLVENMSYFSQDSSGKPIAIFGRGGGEKLSREFGLPLLGKIPIELEIGKGGDSGIPLMISSPNSETGRIFQGIAEKILSAAR